MTNYPDIRGDHDDTFRAPRTEDFVEVFDTYGNDQIMEIFRDVPYVNEVIREMTDILKNHNRPVITMSTP